MSKLDIWEIKHSFDNELINCVNTHCNIETKILDLSKEKFSLYEKFIYDTAMFHFKRLNIEVTDSHFIEFWCKNKFDTHRLHVDCDEYQKKHNMKYIHPLLSCVTYLNDNQCPTIITNVDMECYKYKDFERQTNIYLSMPKCNKQITFDGQFFHGSTHLKEANDDSRYIIAINLWDTMPTNVNYYNPVTDDTIIYNKDVKNFIIDYKDDGIMTLNVNKNLINFDLFENLLYNTSDTTCYRFNQLLEGRNTHFDSYKIQFDATIEKKEIELQLKNKYGDIIDDINEIMNDKIKLKYNRFLQRFCYNKIYTPDICNYIINECEKYATNNGGWTIKRHDNYPTTDLPVEKIPSIFGLVLETLNTVVKKVKKSFGLHDQMIINVHDLFVVKYKDTEQNHLKMHQDGSFLSFNVLLSDTSDFEGGGTYFDDGLTSYLEQGDILIHSSRIKHAGLPITKGTRYLLVGFLNMNILVIDNN
jgi:hypothetical protein